MPIPLLLLAGAGMAGAKGLQKMFHGTADLGDARMITERATRLRDRTQQQIDARDHALQQRAQAFAQYRETVQLTTLVRFAELYARQEKRLNLTDKEFGARFHLPEAALRELQVTSESVLQVAQFVMAAGKAGLAAGKGAAFLAASLGGVASTGTAIGSLSGAAATNATLAWLGGGSLAAGGGGMALGTVVLGGLAAAPALIIAGYGVAAKGEQQLSAAVQFDAEVQTFRARARVRWATQDGIARRLDELAGVLEATRIRLDSAVLACEQQERQSGRVDDATFGPAVLLAQAVSALLKVQVHDEQGELIQDTALNTALTRVQAPALTAAPAERGGEPLDWSCPADVTWLDERDTAAAVLDTDDTLFANVDGRLLVWSFEEDEDGPTDLDCKVGSVAHLQVHPEQDLLIAARGRQSTLLFGNLRTDEPALEELDLDDIKVRRTAVLTTRPHLVLAAKECVMILHLGTGDTVHEWSTERRTPTALAVTADGTRVAVAFENGDLQVRDLTTTRPVWSTAHDPWCTDLAFSPDGRFLLSASEDRTARLWCTSTWSELRRFEFGGRYADRVAFSADGSLLAVAFANSTVGLWETDSGALVNLIDSGTGRVTALQFTAQGDGLMVAGEGGLRLILPEAESAEG